jgi:predicted dithiol-disulfide oxidoreductase (DUF899 family)
MATATFNKPRVVPREEWLAARKDLLVKEKKLTRAKDAIAAERRQLPMVRVEKDYVFEGPDGAVRLADLFGDRSQLLINHFMFGPDWEEGCVGCSFSADHIDGGLIHLQQRDVAFVAVARAPYPKIAAFRQRMGWRFPWVSSFGSDFNFDYGVSFPPDQAERGEIDYNYATQPFFMDEMSGFSVFFKDADGVVYHTYSAFGRGAEEVLTTYVLLDLTLKGRDEERDLSEWVKLHDQYGAAGATGCCHGQGASQA